MSKNKLDTKSMTLMGLLTAMVAIFSFTPIGSVPIGPLVITLNVIPVAIAAAAIGPVGGAMIGGIFGIFSFLQCFGIGVPSAMGMALLEIDPILCFIQRFIPRLLDGLIAGFVFRLSAKVTGVRISCFITGFFTAFLNTLLFMAALVLLFGSTEYMKEIIGGKNIIMFIITFVGINAVFEMLAATLITGAAGSALYKAKFIKVSSEKVR